MKLKKLGEKLKNVMEPKESFKEWLSTLQPVHIGGGTYLLLWKKRR